MRPTSWSLPLTMAAVFVLNLSWIRMRCGAVQLIHTSVNTGSISESGKVLLYFRDVARVAIKESIWFLKLILPSNSYQWEQHTRLQSPSASCVDPPSAIFDSEESNDTKLDCSSDILNNDSSFSDYGNLPFKRYTVEAFPTSRLCSKASKFLLKPQWRENLIINIY
jgi:hypothetical protein